MTLNLTPADHGEELIKSYLEKNASEVLAEKINKGTPFIKDGKQYVNKKSLSSFMDYASKQAKELVQKNKQYAMIEKQIVFDWAIHYFEEDSLEGKLYLPDGTEYVPPKSVYTPKPAVTPTTVKPETKPQLSLFDMFNDNKQEKEEIPVNEKLTKEDIEDAMEALEPTIDDELFSDKPIIKDEPPKKAVSPIYLKYTSVQKQYPNCIIVYRLGDFYEIFGQNAVNVAGILDLTLTGRDCGLDERIPMVGFPYHIANEYISKLTNNGHKVAVVEDLDKITIKEKEPTEKRWLNETTFIDNDGVIHEENNSSMDSAVITVWKKLLGDELKI